MLRKVTIALLTELRGTMKAHSQRLQFVLRDPTRNAHRLDGGSSCYEYRRAQKGCQDAKTCNHRKTGL